MRRIFVNICISVVCMLIMCGCAFLSSEVKNQNYYDLSYNGNEQIELPFNVVFGDFRNVSPAGLNLMFCDKNRVSLDQYNYWTQSPENMLRRFMLNAIKSDYNASVPALEISLMLFEFKFDIAAKKCVLGIRCKASIDGKKKLEKSYLIENPVDGNSKKDYVQGMNICTEKFVNQLINDLKKF